MQMMSQIQKKKSSGNSRHKYSDENKYEDLKEKREDNKKLGKINNQEETNYKNLEKGERKSENYNSIKIKLEFAANNKNKFLEENDNNEQKVNIKNNVKKYLENEFQNKYKIGDKIDENKKEIKNSENKIKNEKIIFKLLQDKKNGNMPMVEMKENNKTKIIIKKFEKKSERIKFNSVDNEKNRSPQINLINFNEQKINHTRFYSINKKNTPSKIDFIKSNENKINNNEEKNGNTSPKFELNQINIKKIRSIGNGKTFSKTNLNQLNKNEIKNKGQRSYSAEKKNQNKNSLDKIKLRRLDENEIKNEGKKIYSEKKNYLNPISQKTSQFNISDNFTINNNNINSFSYHTIVEEINNMVNMKDDIKIPKINQYNILNSYEEKIDNILEMTDFFNIKDLTENSINNFKKTFIELFKSSINKKMPEEYKQLLQNEKNNIHKKYLSIVSKIKFYELFLKSLLKNKRKSLNNNESLDNYINLHITHIESLIPNANRLKENLFLLKNSLEEYKEKCIFSQIIEYEKEEIAKTIESQEDVLTLENLVKKWKLQYSQEHIERIKIKYNIENPKTYAFYLQQGKKIIE